jgi:hypothetical protein
VLLGAKLSLGAKALLMKIRTFFSHFRISLKLRSRVIVLKDFEFRQGSERRAYGGRNAVGFGEDRRVHRKVLFVFRLIFCNFDSPFLRGAEVLVGCLAIL